MALKQGVCQQCKSHSSVGHLLTAASRASMPHSSWTPTQDGIYFTQLSPLLDALMTWTIARGRWIWLQRVQTEHKDDGYDAESDGNGLYRCCEKHLADVGEINSATGLNERAQLDVMTGPSEERSLHRSGTADAARFSFESVQSTSTGDSNITITPETIG